MRTPARIAAAVVAAGIAVSTGSAAVSASPLHDAAVPSTPVAVAAFPNIFTNLYWPQVQMKMDYVTMFTPAQTRTIRDTGIIPPFAGSGLPYSAIGKELLKDRKLDRTVAANGCIYLAINREARWSPALKKDVRWVMFTFFKPADIRANCGGGGAGTNNASR